MLSLQPKMNPFRKIARALGISKSRKRGLYLSWQSIPHPSSYRPRINPAAAESEQPLKSLQAKVDEDNIALDPVAELKKNLSQEPSVTGVQRAIKWANP